MSIEAERKAFEKAFPGCMAGAPLAGEWECRAGWEAWQARAALDAAPKPLDDPRLQGLFSDAISGALAFGAQNTNPPPAGHWLERFWQMGRAEQTLSEAPPAAEPVASWLPLKSPECWCRACDLAANPIATRMSVCPRCGDKRCDRAAHHDNACSTHFAADAAAPAVPQTEPTRAERKAARVHELVNAGPFTGVSEAFDAYMGAACWTDPVYSPDASTWAAAWKAALRHASPQTEKDAARPQFAALGYLKEPFTRQIVDAPTQWPVYAPIAATKQPK
jgi:hypothetical protein